jgi:hypothetical protein
MTTVEKIKHLKTILPCEQFIVTGSYALSLIGLVDEKKVQDIDIILVNPKDEAKALAESMMKQSPAKTTPYNGGSVNAIFTLDGSKIDLFYLDKKQETMKLEEFEIRKLIDIVKAKKHFNRMKDWIQLRNIASKIFIHTDFVKFLDTYEPNK